jgi:DNA-binding IclR family transcriptional regulator
LKKKVVSSMASKIKTKLVSPTATGIETIETGMLLLTVLAELGRPQMLKTIAENAGMPPSKAHRYLVSFSRMGFVARDAETGRYKLGPVSIQIGLAALANTDGVRIATQAAIELRDSFDETTSVAVWGSHGPTIVRIEEASRSEINARAGTVISLLSSSTGQVFAAFLPERVVMPLLQKELKFNARRRDDRLISSIRDAENLIEEVRKRGLGRVTGEMTPGIHALAAPIRDHQGYPAAVVAITGAGEAFDSTLKGDIATLLRKMAADASLQLGYLPAGKQAESTPDDSARTPRSHSRTSS